MSETVNETPAAPVPPVVFGTGDRVKVAGNAKDGTGYSVPSRVLGKVGILDEFSTYSGWYVVPVDGSTGAYVDPDFLTRVTSEDELRAQIAKLTADLTAAQSARDAQASALASFMGNARNAIIAKAEAASYDSDAQEFDDLLDTLDLEGREREFEIRVDVSGSYYLTVSATSLSDAIDEASDTGNVREYLTDNMSSDWLDNVEAEVN